MAIAAGTARAGVVTYSLGEQDFADQSGPITVAEALAAGANEAAPFDGTVYGDDRFGRFGKIHFTYNFLQGDLAGDARLTLGLIGLDSPPGRDASVKLLLDGKEQPNDAFAGVSSPDFRSSASVIDTVVPAWMLVDGKLDVTIKAFRRSPGYPGNAIEADFSTLVMNLIDQPPGTGAPGTGAPGTGEPGTGEPGTGEPGTGQPGTDTPGPTPGGEDPGDGGSHPQPPAVPLPPAVFAGLIGLGLAGWRMRRATSRIPS